MPSTRLGCCDGHRTDLASAVCREREGSRALIDAALTLATLEDHRGRASSERR